MRVLIINKFLHPNGGSETYIFRLGEELVRAGHEVEYFGMEHEGRIVGNSAGAYTSDMDFHGGSKLSKLTYPIKTVYSREARAKIRAVLDSFCPEVCHLNNFNYQLTPSIILEIVKWRRETGRECKIIYTAHDYQLVCPNHLCFDIRAGVPCEKCLGGHYFNCIKGRCIHGSAAKSAVGCAEASFWKIKKTYKYIDKIICCSHFMKSKLDTDPLLADKTVVMHNFIDRAEHMHTEKKDYVLYLGRFSEEKGIRTLTEAAKRLPEIHFVLAGSGPLADSFADVPNITNAGFVEGEEKQRLISEAAFTVTPSECYDNCPFSVMESITQGTAVLGADIGGIPELITEGETGELFCAGDVDGLSDKITYMWEKIHKADGYSMRGAERFLTCAEYTQELLHTIG